jgi:hypothetical protein
VPRSDLSFAESRTLLITFTLTPFSAASFAMSCCPNGQSNHCHSGIVAQPAAEPEAKPACHHEPMTETDPDTIVAEPSDQNADSSASDDSSDDVAPASSVRARCESDCCSLGPSTFKRPTRPSIEPSARKIVIPPLPLRSASTVLAAVLHTDALNLPIPRGPPFPFTV